MAKINRNELTKEMIEKATQCKTADELMALAKTEGYELTAEEAEVYMEELQSFELDEETLKKVAGGDCYCDCWDCSDAPPCSDDRCTQDICLAAYS